MVGFSPLYILITLLYISGKSYESEQCPKFCACLGEFADCSRKEFTKLPPDVPTWMTGLYVFLLMSVLHIYLYLYLCYRNLNNNKIHQLDRPILKELKQLTVLKLNRNKVSQLHKEVFKHQEHLTTLYDFTLYC